MPPVTSTSLAFASLDWQLSKLPAEFRTEAARRNLRDYLAAGNADVLCGMKLVLQEDILGKQKDFDPGRIEIDGQNREWANAAYVESDQAGPPPGRLDFLEFRCQPDAQGNLYVMAKIGGFNQSQQDNGLGLNISGFGPKWLMTRSNFSCSFSKKANFRTATAWPAHWRS